MKWVTTSWTYSKISIKTQYIFDMSTYHLNLLYVQEDLSISLQWVAIQKLWQNFQTLNIARKVQFYMDFESKYSEQTVLCQINRSESDLSEIQIQIRPKNPDLDPDPQACKYSSSLHANMSNICYVTECLNTKISLLKYTYIQYTYIHIQTWP